MDHGILKYCLFIPVVCSAVSARAQSQVAKVPKDSVAQHNVLLSEIVISAPQAERTLMHIDLDKIPVNSAQDMLRKVPGLFIAQHAGGGKAEQIFLRGFDNDHGTDISISADDIPVNMPSHAHGQGYADLHFLIPETVENIDFGKGAYYADKGDFNTSGYVHFHTYESIPESMVKIEGGRFNTARAVTLFNVPVKDSTVQNAYIAGEYYYTNGPFHVPQDFGRLNLLGRYNRKLGRYSHINVMASTLYSKWNASGQIPERAVQEGIIDRFGSIDTTEGGNTHRTNVLFKYTYQPDDRRKWQSSIYYTNYLFNLYSNFTFFLIHPLKGDEINQYDSRNVYGMDHMYQQHFSTGRIDLNWVSGIGMRIDNIRDLQLSYVTARTELNERLAWGTAREANAGVYTSLEASTGKWRIYGGLRADWFYFKYNDKLGVLSNNQYLKKRLSPKLSVYYNASDAISFYVKAGMGFHSNDVRDVVVQQGLNVLPYSAGADLGIVARPANRLIVKPAIWYIYLNNEYVWNGDGYGVSDVGRTRRYGADLSVRWQPTHFVYFDADLNWAVPRLIDAPAGSNYVTLAPTLTSTGGLGLQCAKKWSMNLRYRYMHDRPATDDARIIAPGYFVNDLTVSYQSGKWTVLLQIQNLFNVKWNEAMFAETTRLKGENGAGQEGLTFTPGTPFCFKTGICYRF